MPPPKHKAQLSLDMSPYFDSSELSDCLIVVKGQDEERRFHAHRLILTASSTYFASLFSKLWTSSDAVQAPSKPEVTMQVVEDAANAQTVLEFLYGRHIELDLASAHPLLRLAGYYGIDALSTMCVDYLERVLHPEPTRCFQLFGASDAASSTPSDPKLIALCTEVIARSFADVAEHEAFLGCSVELLLSVLERDDLAVEKEEARTDGAKQPSLV
jgi:hypothetical protein